MSERTFAILVCGGRDYADRERVFSTLDRIRADRASGRYVRIIEGGAFGADRLAQEWAIEHGMDLSTYAADWKKHGNAAGPIRNKQMLDDGKPDLVVAFPGGRGTADMVRRAKAARVRVIEIARDTPEEAAVKPAAVSPSDTGEAP